MIAEDGVGLLVTARALAADAVCAEVVAAMRARGLDPILLKGPVLAQWLYPNDVRGYDDVDLLVEPARVAEADAVLGELGFVREPERLAPHALAWFRESDGANVDLHTELWGPNRPAEHVWEELQDWLDVQVVAGVEVRVLGATGRALLVALHAAHHADLDKPREDLARAVARTPISVWVAAERLGHRLWALPELAEGLSLVPGGEEVLEHLPLTRAAVIAEQQDAPLAVGFTRIAAAEGWRAKLSLLVGAVARPREEFCIDYGPEWDVRAVPSQGRLGLVADYTRRVAWLLSRAPRTLRAMRRANRT